MVSAGSHRARFDVRGYTYSSTTGLRPREIREAVCRARGRIQALEVTSMRRERRYEDSLGNPFSEVTLGSPSRLEGLRRSKRFSNSLVDSFESGSRLTQANVTLMHTRSMRSRSSGSYPKRKLKSRTCVVSCTSR